MTSSMFQLTKEETDTLSRSQFVTSIQTKGVKGGRSYRPYVFMESGIYMLMTVLKCDLVTHQKKNNASLVRFCLPGGRCVYFIQSSDFKFGMQESVWIIFLNGLSEDSIRKIFQKG